MRRPTVLAALAVPLLATAAAAAPAKPAKVCQMLTDRSGDTGAGFDPAYVPVPSSALDILSADVASSAKAIAGAVRVRALQSDAVTATGAQYMLYFRVGEAEWRMSARRRADMADSFGILPPGASFDIPISGSFDSATNSVYFSVPRKVVPELKSFKVSGLRVSAAVNPPGTALDSAVGTRPYTDLQPSCLAA